MAVPLYQAEVGFTAGAQTAPTYFTIGGAKIGASRIGGSFSAAGNLRDVTDRLMAFTVDRGAEDPLSGITAGTATVVLNDSDGVVDPHNTASPWYPNVKMNRGMRLSALWAGTRYYLSYTWTDEISVATAALDATVHVHGTDLLKRLARRKINSTFNAQLSGARVNGILDALTWNTSMRSIQAGYLTLPALSITNSSSLDHIDDLVKAERGSFFIAGNGNIVFRDRRDRFKQVTRGTFGAGGLLVRSVVPSFRDDTILNDIRVKRTAGAEQVAGDTASQNAYDTRTFQLAGGAMDLLPDDGEVAFWAARLLADRKEPTARIIGLELDPAGDDALWPHVLGAELGDRITVTHDSPGTKGMVSEDFTISAIHHTVSFDPQAEIPHLCRWGLRYLGPSTKKYFWIGSARIGTGAYLA